MFAKESGLLQGTLDLLVLKTLSWGPAHGYDVARWIQDVTDDVLRVEEGSLYPALHRLEKQGWISAAWETSENGQRVRVYRLTAAGKRQLGSERSRWEQFANAITAILSAPAEGES